MKPGTAARLLLPAMAAVGALAVSAAPLAWPASASTGITITPAACAGGGSTFCFAPESATATVGAPVTWTNQSGVAHTATSCTSSACPGAPASTGGNTFNVSIGASNGSTGSFTFTNAGTYHYYCTIHGYALMHGTITVSAAATSPPAAASATPSPAPRATGGSSNAPGTGGAPGPIGGVVILGGLAMLILAVAVRRR